jgi:hypothetical protein
MASKSTSEILLAKIEHINLCLGTSSPGQGLLSSPTLWGAVHELAGLISQQSGQPAGDSVFSEEEMEGLQELMGANYVAHVKPLLENSLKNYVTKAASDQNTGLLLDGSDRIVASRY